MSRLGRTLVQRLEDKTEYLPSGCWSWTGGVAGGRNDGDRYGVIRVGSTTDGTRRQEYVHRAIWVFTNGPIPDGLEVDHVAARGCVSKKCWNPDHLELVTRGENNLRKPKMTHCRRGHERNDGRPYCLKCRHLRDMI